MFKSKHNKYTQIPNWFESLNDTVTTTAAVTTAPQIVSLGGVTSDITYTPKKIILYNKFILNDSEINKTQLVVPNTALVAKETETSKIGDLVQAEGWNTSDFLKIASGTTMLVQSTVDEVYGVVFYDNVYTVVDGVNITETIQSVSVPSNAFYFRICSKQDDNFLVTYKVSTFYNSNQLQISNQNIFNYLALNSDINEGLHETIIEDSDIQLLVQNPLSLSRDVNNIIKISLDYDKLQTGSKTDMFEWDKTPSAFGYDASTNMAYSFIDGEQQFTQDAEGNAIPLMTANQDFWQYDENAEDKWVIKALRPNLNLFGGLIEYNQDLDVFYFHKSIITTGGIVMYADDDFTNIPIIAEGLPFDNKTIKYNPTTKQIEVIGGVGGVSDFWKLENRPEWIGENKPTYNYTEIEGTPNLSNYALKTDIPSLNGYATQDWVNQKYVPIAGTTNITGLKTFSAGLQGNYWKIAESGSNPYLLFTTGTPKWYIQLKNNKLSFGKDGASTTIDGNGNLEVTGGATINGNLLVKGGITFYSTNGAVTPFLIDVTKIDEINSTSTTQVYTANAVKILKEGLSTELTSVKAKLTTCENKLTGIKDALSNISNTSDISAIRSALIAIRTTLN